MDKYTELYAWIWKAFGKDSFSIDQFRATFPVSQGPKIAHDLIMKGYLKRVGHGMYTAASPSELVETATEKEADLGILEGTGKDYAFSENTSVSIWTDGYYWTGFTKGFRPVSVIINRKDRAFWARFLRSNGIKYVFEGENKTLYGQVFVLHPQEKVYYQEKEGLKVIPLDEVLDFCFRHELIYQPALEYLRAKYGTGYRRRKHENA
jgi:hypothetical protein